MVSSVKEDYLKAIYEPEKRFGIAKTNQIAKKLHLRAATVTEMTQRLAKDSPKILNYRSHQGVKLTPGGHKAALAIVRRHRILETFLHETLGLGWDEVHREAEILEHHISQRVTEALDRHLGFPQWDPHGEPIPDSDGNVKAQSALILSNVEVDAGFKVSGVEPVSADLLVYLKKIGIGLGTSGRVVAKAPFEGPLEIIVDGPEKQTRYSLSRSVTDRIFVRTIS